MRQQFKRIGGITTHAEMSVKQEGVYLPDGTCAVRALVRTSHRVPTFLM